MKVCTSDELYAGVETRGREP